MYKTYKGPERAFIKAASALEFPRNEVTNGPFEMAFAKTTISMVDILDLTLNHRDQGFKGRN